MNYYDLIRQCLLEAAERLRMSQILAEATIRNVLQAVSSHVGLGPEKDGGP